jgi:putative lipoic acid-binding regulatory protein
MLDLNQIEGKGFEFPCEYPIKAMGPNTPAFAEQIINLVKQHAPEVSANSVHCKTSSTGKYQSVTVLVYALSKDHLISIYQDINKVEDLMWTL